MEVEVEVWLMMGVKSCDALRYLVEWDTLRFLATTRVA